MWSRDLVQALYPRAPEPHLESFARGADDVFLRFGIAASINRLHFFLAQIGHESDGLRITIENLKYTAKRMHEVWPTRFPTVAAGQPYEGEPEKLANVVYGGRMGNGPPESGDGWRYRGRGYIQVTGKDGYAAVGRIADLDLVADPDRAVEPGHALTVACAFWRWKNLNPICDRGDFTEVTRLINGGFTGLSDRHAWLERVRQIVVPSAVPLVASRGADGADPAART